MAREYAHGHATKVPEIRKGDTVVLLSGKDAGKRGTVERVVRRTAAPSATRSAYRRGTRHLVAGMCETDYSGYPDCRDDTIKAMQVALTLGLDKRVTIHTPLMWIDKADTFAMAEQTGGKAFLDLLIEDSHSCYLGDRSKRHDWGYGCGECPACRLRANGFAEWQAGCAEAGKQWRG